MKYLKKASDLGNTDGMIIYGFGLSKGYLGSIDLPGAMKYYKMASDLGNHQAMKRYSLLQALFQLSFFSNLLTFPKIDSSFQDSSEISYLLSKVLLSYLEI
jgi:TPR repeat protein